MLYKRNILAIRGSFRPVTKVNLDMMERGLSLFREENRVEESNIQLLFEITLNNLKAEGDIDEKDFLGPGRYPVLSGAYSADLELPGILQTHRVLLPLHQEAHGRHHGWQRHDGPLQRALLPRV